MGTADLQVSGRQRGIARAPSKVVNMDALTAQDISRLQGRLVAERDAIRTRIAARGRDKRPWRRSEEHTSELQSPDHLVCRLLLEKKKDSIRQKNANITMISAL